MTTTKIKSPSTIWSSVEVYCWCRDLPHSQYLEIHEQSCCESKPVSELFYKELGLALYNEMIRDCDEQNETNEHPESIT